MGKRQELREKRAKQQRTQRIFVVIGVTLVALAVALAFILSNLPQDPGEITVPEFFERPQPDLNTAGNPNAPIRIEVYSDYRCVHCRDFYAEKEREIIEQYVAAGKVYWVYKTVDFGGEESLKAGVAAYCAGEQGRFWDMHDIIFANFGTSYSDVRLNAFAAELGLDANAFKSCLSSSSKYVAQVQSVTTADTQKAGVHATPSFVLYYTVNGEEKSRLLEGNQPIAVFAQTIQEILTELGQ